MTKHDDKMVKDLLHNLGLLNGLPKDVLKEIVESQFKMIRDVIENLDFDKQNDKTNFSLKHIGKIYTSDSRINSIKNKGKYVKRNKG